MSEKFKDVPLPREGKEKENKVVFRPKSLWQKNDCINRSAEYDCPNESTIEAVFGDAIVRCCEDEKCKARAAELAKLTGETDKKDE